MKTCIFIASGILVLILLVPTVSAQDLPKAEMRQDVNYYIALYTKFKIGMGDEAKKMIYNDFLPVYKELGIEVIPFDTMTGEWDNVAFFPLTEGPGELAWEMSPTDEKLLKAFVERKGSMEQMQEINSRFNELIARQKTEIVMTRWNGSK